MRKPLKIRIKYFDSSLERIQKIRQGDWLDLRAAEDVVFETDDYKRIPLGVAMELPKGYEAHVRPKSSTFEKFGITQTNSVGVIDESYKGDNDMWQFPAKAHRPTTIRKNDRICQFRLVEKQPEIEFEEVDSLGNSDRGGFGSTGHQ